MQKVAKFEKVSFENFAAAYLMFKGPTNIEIIKKIYEDRELEKNSTIKNFLIVQNEGSRTVSRSVDHYNLQMIIAVGFKVNNERAVQFRRWH